MRVGDVLDSVNGQQLRGAELPEVGYSLDQFVLFCLLSIVPGAAFGFRWSDPTGFFFQIERIFRTLHRSMVDMRLYRNVSLRD